MNCWFGHLQSAAAHGAPGSIVRFNTSDFAYATDASKAMAVPRFVASEFYENGFAVSSYTLSQGLQNLTPPGCQKRSHDIDCIAGDDPVSLIRQLGTCLRKRGEHPLALIIDYAEHVIPQGNGGTDLGGSTAQLQVLEMIHAWSLDDQIRRAGNFVVLIERGGSVNPLLIQQGRFIAIEIPLPDEQGRQGFLDAMLALGDESLKVELADGIDARLLAKVSSGLRLMDLETIFRRAAAAQRPIEVADVTERKQHTITELCGGLLEVVKPNQRGFNAIAGNYNAKAYFQRIKPQWRIGSPSLPMGVLLAGVPGTGKSFLIRALAHEFDIPCVAMRSVREMWVGQSERNLERVLSTLDALAPCLLWSDEVDQTVGQDRETQGGGDSGTSSRMLARFLEFTGDSARRGKILWVGTTNRPDLLDPATLSRFEVRIPFLHPRGSELAELWPELFRQLEREYVGDFGELDLKDSRFDMLSARSLMELISLAGLFADEEHGEACSPVSKQHMERAVAEVEPEYDDGTLRRIALTALHMTRWHSLMPWNAMGNPEAAANGWPAYLVEFVDPDTGRLRRDRTAQALGIAS